MPYLEESQRGFVNGESTRVCFVRCRDCNARSPRVDIKEFGRTSHSAEAIKIVVDAWNRRTKSDKIIDYKTRIERRIADSVEPQQAASNIPAEPLRLHVL